jgi:hypothetical protein
LFLDFVPRFRCAVSPASISPSRRYASLKDIAADCRHINVAAKLHFHFAAVIDASVVARRRTLIKAMVVRPLNW